MEDDRTELIAQLFYLLTMVLEDGASLAANGQGKTTIFEQCRELTGQLYDRGQQVMILCNAVLALLDGRSPVAAQPRS